MAGAASEDNPVGINVTALVDIIFCLCLFFMCSLKFKELEGKLDSWLPKDKGVQQSNKMNDTVDEIRVLMSYDKENPSDVLAMVGASAALHISDIPWAGPFAVRMRYLNDSGFEIYGAYLLELPTVWTWSR